MKEVGLTEIVALIPLGIVIIWIIFECLHRGNDSSSNIVKAGERYPILGNALEFLPERLFKTIIKYSEMGDAVEFMLVGTRGIMISDADTTRELMSKRPKLFRRRKGLDYSAKKLGVTTGLFHSNGVLWSRIRRGTAPSFSILSMKKQYDPILRHVQTWIRGLRERASKDKVFDMKFETFQLTMRVVTVVAFGIALDDPVNQYFFSAQCREDINYFFGYSIETLLSPIPKWAWRFTKQGVLEQRAMAATNRFNHHCMKIIEQKRQKIQSLGDSYTPDCMIETLMTRAARNNEDQQPADDLIDDEIIANLKTFYLAGSDTTSVVLTWSFYIFSLYPEILQKARDEVTAVLLPAAAGHSGDNNSTLDSSLLSATAELKWEDFQNCKYIQGIIKEILRLYGPTTGVSMELEHGFNSITVGQGITINPGDLIWINTDGIHLREQYFTNAQTFLPERWLTSDVNELHKMENAFFAFGSGPRACPGMNMAYMEAIIAVSMLAVTFDFKLACTADEVKRIVNFSNSANKMPVVLSACL